MTKIAVFADSTMDINLDLGKQFGIEVIPYNVQMGDKTYVDMVEITSAQFYEQMGDYDVLKTGVPSIQKIIDRFDQVKEQGYDEAILITSAQTLTGMHNAYQAAINEYEGLNFHLVETPNVASVTGLCAIHAAQMRDLGASAQEIVEEVDRIKDNGEIFALFRTLKYLVKGGRFSPSKGMIGNLLKVMPMMTIKNGEVTPVATYRGKKKSHKGLVEMIREKLGDKKNFKLSLFSSNNPKEIEEIKEEVSDIVEKAETFVITEFTPLLGVHSGPDLIGFSYVLLD